MVFQDPYGSLDPRQTVARIVAEPLEAQAGTSAAEQRRRVAESLAAVGLRASDLDKISARILGRSAPADRHRARVDHPAASSIVADEPVSALDVSVQAQVLNLMQDLQREFGITYLLISHDLAVVDHLCAEVAVIFHGRIVEQGAPQTAVPRPRRIRTPRPCSPPSARMDAARHRAWRRAAERTITVEPASSCRARALTPTAAACAGDLPTPSAADSSHGRRGHRVACHFPSRLTDQTRPTAAAQSCPKA